MAKAKSMHLSQIPGKQSSVYDSDERAKGFTQKGIPEKKVWEANEGQAAGSTSADRASNEQREDKA